jgi:hypothetical protein
MPKSFWISGTISIFFFIYLFSVASNMRTLLPGSPANAAFAFAGVEMALLRAAQAQRT